MSQTDHKQVCIHFCNIIKIMLCSKRTSDVHSWHLESSIQKNSASFQQYLIAFFKHRVYFNNKSVLYNKAIIFIVLLIFARSIEPSVNFKDKSIHTAYTVYIYKYTKIVSDFKWTKLQLLSTSLPDSPRHNAWFSIGDRSVSQAHVPCVRVHLIIIDVHNEVWYC